MMRQTFYKWAFTFAIGLCAVSPMLAQSTSEREVKKGWNFGPLPAVSYSTDTGFQYGALCDIYYYGDGKQYPDYLHKLYLEASTFTKGSSVFNLFYDSKYLLKGIRTTFNVSYLPNTMYDFYGFNGYMGSYDPSQEGSFYFIDRKYFRTQLDFQGRLANHLNWALGAGFHDYALSPVQLEKYDGTESLWSEYAADGLIDSERVKGSVLEIRAGLVYDTRNQESDPRSGFWSELSLTASPDITGNNRYNYGKVSLIHRGYLPVGGDKLTLAYRAMLQQKLYGEIPVYQIQNITSLYSKKTYSEGIGGYTTIRGMLNNRAIGEGIAVANVELRYRFAHFNLIGQHWYLVCNPFFDAGMVTDTYMGEEMAACDNKLIYSGNAEGIHTSAGVGIKLIMNQNFIINGEYGVALDKRDGSSAVIIGVNYIF